MIGRVWFLENTMTDKLKRFRLLDNNKINCLVGLTEGNEQEQFFRDYLSIS